MLYLDTETYFNSKIGYTLKKLSGVEYVRDPRFKILCLGIARNDDPVKVYLPEDLHTLKSDFDWENETVVCHKTLFDGLILVERLGIVPKQWNCTLSIARSILPLEKNSLGDVAQLLGMAGKVDGYLTNGMEIADDKLIAGLIRDVELCRSIYKRLAKYLPEEQHRIIHRLQRWGVQSKFVLNQQLLTEELDRIEDERNALIAASGYSEKQLGSNPQFRKIVEDLGIEPPTKISKQTEEEADAFSKNDPEFQALMLEFPEHSALWNARLAAKSTIHRTRVRRYLNIASLGNGTMPMPINYYGAKTGRPTGGDGLNVLNLPKDGRIREAFQAPPGHKVLVADSSQIELRLNFWFCGQNDKIELLRNGDDLYIAEAANQFRKPHSAITKTDRQYGKVCLLGLGYRMGKRRFREFCASGPLGMDPIYLTEHEAESTVDTYREGNWAVKDTWFWLDDVLPSMISETCDIRRGPVRFVHNAIELPNGMHILYSGLRWHVGEDGRGSWVYGHGKRMHFLHGGIVLENIIQALANIIISNQIDEFELKYPEASVSYTYDEIINLIRDEDVEEAESHLIEVMSKPPIWAPDLPLSAESHVAPWYSK